MGNASGSGIGGRARGVLMTAGLMQAVVLAGGAGVGRAEGTSTTIKAEHFDRDPGWEGVGNRVTPEVNRGVK